MVAKDLNEVNAFLDNLPSSPCRVKKPEALCSLCEKLNNDVHSACQEADRDGSGMLLGAGGFTEIDERPVAFAERASSREAPARDASKQPEARVRKVSETVSIEFMKPTKPPPGPISTVASKAPASSSPSVAPSPRAVEPPFPKSPGAMPGMATVPEMPPPPPPPESPVQVAPTSRSHPEVPDLDSLAPKGKAPQLDERIEMRDKTTGLALEFVPKKRHFKAKPKDELWDEIMGEKLFRSIMDEFLPPPAPVVEIAEVEIADDMGFPGEVPGGVPAGIGSGFSAEVALPGALAAAMPDGAIAAEEYVVDVVEAVTVEGPMVYEPEVLDVDIVVEGPPSVPELGGALSQIIAMAAEGRQEEALAAFDAHLQTDPASVDALLGKGYVLRIMKRFDASIAALDAALSVQPARDDVSAERTRAVEEKRAADLDAAKAAGDAAFMDQRFPEAVEQYDIALAIVPDDTRVLNNKALALRALQRFEEAKAVYLDLMRIEPDDLKAQKGLERTNLAMEQVRAKQAAPEGAAEEPVKARKRKVKGPSVDATKAAVPEGAKPAEGVPTPSLPALQPVGAPAAEADAKKGKRSRIGLRKKGGKGAEEAAAEGPPAPLPALEPAKPAEAAPAAGPSPVPVLKKMARKARPAAKTPVPQETSSEAVPPPVLEPAKPAEAVPQRKDVIRAKAPAKAGAAPPKWEKETGPATGDATPMELTPLKPVGKQKAGRVLKAGRKVPLKPAAAESGIPVIEEEPLPDLAAIEAELEEMSLDLETEGAGSSRAKKGTPGWSEIDELLDDVDEKRDE
ncbi:MAG: hypothetical protein L0Z54_04790 [Thermoplasmata archaeon]|nr:hypothetical protein [Thermoplasmata archaeon]